MHYVHIDEHRKVEIREVFLRFFQINKKDAGSLVNKILRNLKKTQFPLETVVAKHMIMQQLWLA